MTDAILQGVIWGFILCVSIGPVFFLLIQTSIKEGIKPALIMDIGIVGSDIFCLALAYLGTSRIFEDSSYRTLIGLIGGAILIGFGLVPFLTKKKEAEIEFKNIRTTSISMLIFKGFILNTTNPFVFLFWIGYIGVGVTQFKDDTQLLWIYFISTFVIIIITDFLKAYLANRIKSRLTPHTMGIINKVSGIGILIFGILLIARVLLD